MPAHSVIVLNSQGNVLFSKYFHDPNLDKAQCCRENLAFEQILFRHTNKIWTNKTMTQLPQTLAINDVYIVFQRIGELLVFVSGVDDIDEVVLNEILVAFRHVLDDLSGGKLTEQVFLGPENLGKWIISVDEVMPQGILETTDPELIVKLGKVKSG